MIKKIKSIKNMAVYKDFEWDKSVRDKGGQVVNFQRVNILYGRNYSGKTTISRIVRALETGLLSDKYLNPEFNVEIQGEPIVTQNTLKSHLQTIRVFNEDFVKDNLQFINNSEESIKSFAILGDNNNKLELDIKEKERELGSEDVDNGLLGELRRKNSELSMNEKLTKEATSNLEKKLTDKANKAGTGIKHNKLYGDATYNVVKLKADILKVTLPSYKLIDEDHIDKLKKLLKEEPKPIVDESQILNLLFMQLSQRVQSLVEKKITISNPIKELLDNALLQEWVRIGREHHGGKRNTCAFCGNPIPLDLMEKLNKHFSKESEDLRLSIKSLKIEIDLELKRTSSLLAFNVNDFYSEFSDGIVSLQEEFNVISEKYSDSLRELNAILDERLGDIFTSINFRIIEDVSPQLERIRSSFELIRIKSDGLTKTLSKEQQTAITALRQNEVYLFVKDIRYSEAMELIGEQEKSESEAKINYVKAFQRVKEFKGEIEALKAQLKDESKGADRVNDYLNNFFGHESLSLKAIEGDMGYRFEVVRNGQKAHHLSEGECSLVAFCYFMAKLDDVETKDNNPIIWIDDPISSLDGNHIFFVFSLINSEIVKAGQFKQLFISTHSLDFLKYLKKIFDKDVNKNKLHQQHFIVERTSNGTQIKVMPFYLKSYVTEFNYLFHQIHKCANADMSFLEDGHDYFYNYANNARKFLESYLYYKYPNANKDDKGKLLRFFGDDTLSTVLMQRVTNEYSHLEGVFERSISPIDIPEMKQSAQLILDKIKEKDPDQYDALLESIAMTS